MPDVSIVGATGQHIGIPGEPLIVSDAGEGGATEDKQDDIITQLVAIEGAVDGLETAVASTNTKLDTVNTNLTTLDGRVDGIEALLATANATEGRTVSAAFTPAGAVLSAGDVVTGPLTFTALGAGAGPHYITGASLMINRNAIISGETSYRLELFSVTPPSALAEGDAFALAAGDQASYLGSIDLGTPIDKGDTMFVQQTGINLPVMLASANVFAYLVSVGAHTSTAVAYTPKLHSLAV